MVEAIDVPDIARFGGLSALEERAVVAVGGVGGDLTAERDFLDRGSLEAGRVRVVLRRERRVVQRRGLLGRGLLHDEFIAAFGGFRVDGPEAGFSEAGRRRFLGFDGPARPGCCSAGSAAERRPATCVRGRSG